MLDLPVETRKGAIFDLFEEHKAALTNQKFKNIKHFSMKFRSQKDSYHMIRIFKQGLKSQADNGPNVIQGY